MLQSRKEKKREREISLASAASVSLLALPMESDAEDCCQFTFHENCGGNRIESSSVRRSLQVNGVFAICFGCSILTARRLARVCPLRRERFRAASRRSKSSPHPSFVRVMRFRFRFLFLFRRRRHRRHCFRFHCHCGPW
jgi:hypothetical protein